MTITINNRELLRSYRNLKDMLINGEIEEINIPQKNNITIKIIAAKKNTPFEELLKKINSKPIKNIHRPEEDII